MKIEAPPDRAVAELRKQGFNVEPWAAASAIAEFLGRPKRDARVFERGTVNGLLEIQPDAINVVALNNDKPGNGQFRKVVTRLERVADELGVTLRVVEFWNLWLWQWFVRRGYDAGTHPEWGVYAERKSYRERNQKQ